MLNNIASKEKRGEIHSFAKINIRVIAHRGYSSHFKENTIESFLAAIKAGAQVIECDIRYTKDNEPVVFHDLSLSRLTGIKKNINFLSWKEIDTLTNSIGFSIPHLSEVLDLLKEYDKWMYLDLKEITEENIYRLSTLLEKKGYFNKVSLILPYSDFLKLKKIITRIPIVLEFFYPFWGIGNFKKTPLVEEIALFMPYLDNIRIIDFLEIVIHRFSRAIIKCSEQNLRVSAGIANTKSSIEWLSKFDLSGIWTDNPSLFVEIL